ncbi:MAG TPA: methylmalonyl-CoA mutase family protein, partial [Synergistales bacterium]|nr:methylmalonyl-CoA mutase family protein [Synergistales bacterium]
NQEKALKAMKQGRDNVLVGNRLDEVKAAARDENLNLMPAMIDAVKVYATEGEICGVLREEFGEYRENIVL